MFLAVLALLRKLVASYNCHLGSFLVAMSIAANAVYS